MSKELDSVVCKSKKTKPSCEMITGSGFESAAKSGSGATLNKTLISLDKAPVLPGGSKAAKSGTGGTLEFGSLKKKAADRSIYS